MLSKTLRPDRRTGVSFVVLCWLLFAPSAQAIGPECPTWFPDFADCGRHGRYEGFGHTYSLPFLFEDPFITTEIRAWGRWHDIPNDSVLGGGDAWAAAVQARIALTDRLAFIATKDGYLYLDPDNEAIFHNTDGFMNVSAGFKYALIDMREDDFILTPSVRFEIPVGQDEILQGWGDGVIIPAVAAAYGIGKAHAIADFGWQIPFDMDQQSTSYYWALHLDYAIFEHLTALVEFAGMGWVNSGDGGITVKNSALSPDPSLAVAQSALMVGGFEGVDILNLGSPDVKGNYIGLFGVGLEVPINQHVSIGALYNFPITDREDLYDERVTLAINLEF